MVISSQLPMLPHLTCLRISCHRIHGSLLLSSLQCTPKLKELRVEGGLVMDGPMGPLTGPVQLPNLTYITIISVDLESAAVFANIEYPPRANVFFRHDRQHRGEPDLSALVAMSRRFQIAPLPIDTALLGCSSSVQALHWNNTPAWYFRTLMKSPSIELPLPGLERLYLSKCDFMVMDAQLFEGLKGFLKERKDLGTPVVRAKIRMSSITEEAVEDLEEFTEVDWDGEESVFGSDEECLSYDLLGCSTVTRVIDQHYRLVNKRTWSGLAIRLQMSVAPCFTISPRDFPAYMCCAIDIHYIIFKLRAHS
ncbi:hypothetical protein IMY05_C4902000100 [Salix suchowensis]|nr:hypothetical protein IMY05_C4902000100 [Salix suchowensis]